MSNQTRFAIAAGAPETAAAGAQIATAGGNVVDVAVAAAMAGTVAEVLLASLCGSCFIMVRLDGEEPVLIDGADAVPSIPDSNGDTAAPWRDVLIPYGDGIVVKAGHASIAVPGLLAALHLAWSRYGSMPWKEVVAPAFALSRQQLPVGKTMDEWLGMAGKVLFAQQEASRACFLPDGLNPLVIGQTYRLPDLDHTIEAIANEGADIFYRGDLGKRISEEILSHGGFVTRQDLASYQAIERSPLRIDSGDYQLALNPPPAFGGAALASIVRYVEHGWDDALSAAEHAALQAEAQQLLLKLRKREFIEPDYGRLSVSKWLSPDYLVACASRLQSPNTTHLSVSAADGSAVAITMSMGYGAGVTIPGTGMACNNSLGEPELNPRGFLKTETGRHLPSNMAPTIAFDGHGNCLAFGSPGASRITTALAQTWIRFALEGLSIEESIHAPRLHIEPQPNQIRVLCEPGIDTGILQNKYSVRQYDRLNMFFGAPKLTGTFSDGRLIAIADERRYGGIEYI